MNNNSPKAYQLADLFAPALSEETILSPIREDRQVAELSNIIYISLDTFHSVVQNIDTPLHAWLTFLSAWKAEDILKLVNVYPRFVELYQELSDFRVRTEDIMGYFSEALYMLDHGTAEYMCEEQKKEIRQLKEEKTSLASENTGLKTENIDLKDENESLKKQLESLQQQLALVQK